MEENRDDLPETGGDAEGNLEKQTKVQNGTDEAESREQGGSASGSRENQAEVSAAVKEQRETAENESVTGENSAETAQEEAVQDGDIDTVHAMIRELGELIAANQNPPEPTPEEKQAAALAAKKARKKKIRKRRHKAFRGMLLRLFVLVVVVYVLLFHLVGVTVMPNGDMYPRIDSGDLVLFYRLDKDVRAQDIIVFEKDLVALQALMDETAADGPALDLFVPDSVHETPVIAQEADESFGGKIREYWNKAVEFLRLRRDESKQVFICRVVAAAGDTVEITDDGRLIVNGNAMIESNIFSQTTSYVSFTQYPLTLHAGECFVMADLRNGGADSRFFGPVKEEEILGTVITIMRRNNL